VKTVLVVLDGLGYSKKLKGNAVKLAETPNYDSLVKNYPTCHLKTYGAEVGLPPQGLGGSKVGHEHMGAGRIVKEEALLIDDLIASKKFFKNKNLKKAMETKRLHLIGLVSDKYVHSHVNHLLTLLETAKKAKVPEVYIHFISDGRDCANQSAPQYAQIILDKINELKLGKIATLIGRYYAMDRNKQWSRTKKALNLMTKGKGTPATDIFDALEKAYKKVDNDQYIEPFIIDKNGLIRKRDSIIMFNFRADRARQLIEKLKQWCKKITTMTEYFDKQKIPLIVHKADVENSFGEYISNLKMKQLRLAETEKYAHVTYFFNGGKSQFKGEDRILVKSPKVKTYNKSPRMSADALTKRAVKAIKTNKYNFILINYSNPDMLGHTGKLKAAIKGINFMDKCLGKIINICDKNEYLLIVSADHGNAEEMTDEFGEISTAHSLNPVTFTIKTTRQIDLKNGGLKNISPTILDYWNIDKPKEMSSKSLII